MSELRKSGENCTVTAVSGFLKDACFDETKNRHYFKCTHSDVYFNYVIDYFDQLKSISTVCENDPHVYQACGHGSNTEITNTDVLCGGLFCNNKYMRCIKNCSVDKNCPVSQINRTPDLQEYTVTTASYTTSNTVREYPATDLCNNKCDGTHCIDESDCNGYKYGVYCIGSGRNWYCPVK